MKFPVTRTDSDSGTSSVENAGLSALNVFDAALPTWYFEVAGAGEQMNSIQEKKEHV
jgi:hypothetical protein